METRPASARLPMRNGYRRCRPGQYWWAICAGTPGRGRRVPSCAQDGSQMHRRARYLGPKYGPPTPIRAIALAAAGRAQSCASGQRSVSAGVVGGESAGCCYTSPRRRRSSAVEQLFRKQQVIGSNPIAGSMPRFWFGSTRSGRASQHTSSGAMMSASWPTGTRRKPQPSCSVCSAKQLTTDRSSKVRAQVMSVRPTRSTSPLDVLPGDVVDN
jgi:hypothetical protein